MASKGFFRMIVPGYYAEAVDVLQQFNKANNTVLKVEIFNTKKAWDDLKKLNDDKPLSPTQESAKSQLIQHTRSGI